MRQVRRIHPGGQDMGEPLLARMTQGGGQPAQWAEARLRPIGYAAETRLCTPAYDQSAALCEERGGDPVDQPRALIKRLGLVAAEPPRLSSGKDRAENDQSNASVACPSAL